MKRRLQLLLIGLVTRFLLRLGLGPSVAPQLREHLKISERWLVETRHNSWRRVPRRNTRHWHFAVMGNGNAATGAGVASLLWLCNRAKPGAAAVFAAV